MHKIRKKYEEWHLEQHVMVFLFEFPSKILFFLKYQNAVIRINFFRFLSKENIVKKIRL